MCVTRFSRSVWSDVACTRDCRDIHCVCAVASVLKEAFGLLPIKVQERTQPAIAHEESAREVFSRKIHPNDVFVRVTGRRR